MNTLQDPRLADLVEDARHQGGSVSHLRPRGSRQRELLISRTCVNPHGPPQAVLDALAGLTADDLREHPEYAADDFLDAYGDFLGVDPGQMLAGQGISDILAAVVDVYPDAVVIVPDYTRTIARLRGRHFPAGPVLCTTAEQRLEYVAAAMARFPAVVLSNPCNPEGVRMLAAELAGVAAANPGSLLFVDEAYAEFPADGDTLLGVDLPNVAVFRSPNKPFGCCGFRVGAMWTRSEHIATAVAGRLREWTISTADGVGIVAALGCRDWLDQTRRELLTVAGWLEQHLVAIFGADAVPQSPAHFRFVHLPDPVDVDRFRQHLTLHRVSGRTFIPGEGRLSGMRLVAPTLRDWPWLQAALSDYQP